MQLPNKDRVLKALQQYEALVDVERATGMRTTHSRNDVLQSLSNPDLTCLALILKARGLIGGAK